MPIIELTPNLARQTRIESRKVGGSTVREAIDSLFEEFPAARSYVLDDQGELRQHMVVFVDGESISDRRTLSDPVGDGEVIFVMQALSGG